MKVKNPKVPAVKREAEEDLGPVTKRPPCHSHIDLGQIMQPCYRSFLASLPAARSLAVQDLAPFRLAGVMRISEPNGVRVTAFSST